MAEEQTPETQTGDTPATPLEEPPAAPETEEVGAPEETSSTEETPAAEPPSISGGSTDPEPPTDSPPSQGEGAAAATPEPEPGPRVFAFSCPNGQAATFIGEGGHGDQHGGPVIPRDVRCPVCGLVMELREPFSLATADKLIQEVGAEV